jgi:protein SCO1/2
MDFWVQKIVSMFRTVFLRTSWLFGLACFTACSGNGNDVRLPYYNTPDFTPVFLSSEKEAAKKITHTIAPFSFTNQHGKTVTDKDISGKIHVANFIFTRCFSICPVMTKNLEIVQQKFGDNPGVAILSFSVTPWIDNVARLKVFAAQHQITSPNWHLLTGDKDQIYNLARKSYFAEEELGFTKDSTDFLHTEHILLIDAKKRIRGIYNGTLKLETEQLAKDIKRLLEEER